MAVKPQLACFERLGAPGWAALAEVCRAAQRAGLLVVADGKRGDVPVTATAYGQALVGETETPWGPVRGLDADAFTANPLLGDDEIEVLIAAARDAGAGVFLLVRTSNPGAARLQDAMLDDRPMHEGARSPGGRERVGAGRGVGALRPGCRGRGDGPAASRPTARADAGFGLPHPRHRRAGRPARGPRACAGRRAPGVGVGGRLPQHRERGRSGGGGGGAPGRRLGPGAARWRDLRSGPSTIASPRMPDYKPNQIIRAFAVMALIAAFVLVVVIIATSGGRVRRQ